MLGFGFLLTYCKRPILLTSLSVTDQSALILSEYHLKICIFNGENSYGSPAMTELRGLCILAVVVVFCLSFRS